MHILSPETDNWPSWINGRDRMIVENISWSISTKNVADLGGVESETSWSPVVRASNCATETVTLLCRRLGDDLERQCASTEFWGVEFLVCWGHWGHFSCTENCLLNSRPKGVCSGITLYTVKPRYNDSICSQKCHENEFAFVQNTYWTDQCVRKVLFCSYFLIEHMFWIFVRIASTRQF